MGLLAESGDKAFVITKAGLLVVMDNVKAKTALFNRYRPGRLNTQPIRLTPKFTSPMPKADLPVCNLLSKC